MAQVDDMDATQETQYETPTFDPRGAFARTLRGGEMARLGRLQRQNGLPVPSELAGTQPGDAARVNGKRTSTPRPRRIETPTFHPRGAFATTLRAGEIARLERRQRLSDVNRDVLVTTG